MNFESATFESIDLSPLQEGMVRWWRGEDFNFPWRTDAHAEWQLLVTEVLLQRTRAKAVSKVYADFFSRFNDPGELARASVEDIEEEIYSLGLAWRAKYLKPLGETLAANQGSVPQNRADIEALPGIGQYAAGAFLALHRNQNAPFIDTNVVRLLGRYVGFSWDGETRRRSWLKNLVSRLFEHNENPSTFGYALLDFTREICGRTPDCENCPLAVRQSCSHFASMRA